MSPGERRSKLAAVTRFDRAVADYAFMGSFHPDEMEGVKRRYELARANLLRKLGFEVK